MYLGYLGLLFWAVAHTYDRQFFRAIITPLHWFSLSPLSLSLTHTQSRISNTNISHTRTCNTMMCVCPRKCACLSVNSWHLCRSDNSDTRVYRNTSPRRLTVHVHSYGMIYGSKRTLMTRITTKQRTVESALLHGIPRHLISIYVYLCVCVYSATIATIICGVQGHWR